MEINEEQKNESDENLEDDGSSRIIEYGSDDDSDKRESVSDKLKLIYDLQKIDKELADIEEEKGDLPAKILDLTTKIKELEERLEGCKANYENFDNEEKKIIREKKQTEDRANKYDEEKYNVRNNKEYDEISKMIDECLEIIEKNEARLKELNKFKFDLEKDQKSISAKLKDLITDRDESQAELDGLNTEFEEEETGHIKNRTVLVKKLDYELKSLYERINSSFKGEAIAVVRKGNCSGCYNSIPPQRVIEIRMAKEVYTCQSCGRILIDELRVSEQ